MTLGLKGWGSSGFKSAPSQTFIMRGLCSQGSGGLLLMDALFKPIFLKDADIESRSAGSRTSLKLARPQ